MLAATLLALAGGCDGGDEPAAPAAGTAAVATGCTKEDVEQRVREFAAALQDADLATLRETWGDDFKWFSVTRLTASGRKHFVAQEPEKALRWVEARGGLPLTIREVQGGERPSREPALVGASYRGKWNGMNLIGKAELMCDSPQIRLWSAAVRPSPAPLD